MLVRTNFPEDDCRYDGRLPGKASLGENIGRVIPFILNNTKNRLAIFDSSILTGPHFSYVPDDAGGSRVLNITPVEHAIYGGLIGDGRTMQRMADYYGALRTFLDKTESVLTSEVKIELVRNLRADIFRLKFLKKKDDSLVQALTQAVTKLLEAVVNKSNYTPRYKIKNGVFMGEINQQIKPHSSKADLEGIACFFEMVPVSGKGVALVSADGGQVGILERHASKNGIKIESKFCYEGRKNYVILGGGHENPEGKGL